MVHTFNPGTWETEAGESLNSKRIWSTKQVSGKPVLHRETVSKTKPNQTKRQPYYVAMAGLELSFNQAGLQYKHLPASSS